MRRLAAIAPLLAIAALAALPAAADNYVISMSAHALVYMAAALTWGFMAANAEMVSLGPQIFIGLGSYSLALLTNNFGVPAWAAVVLSALLSAVVAYGLSYPLLRLKGLYFSVASLLVAQVFMMFFLNWEYAGGADGLAVAVATRMPLAHIYYYALGVAAVASAAMYLSYYSKLGYGLRAVGSDEEAAEDAGVNPFRVKAALFVLHAAITAAAGGVNALNKGYLYPLSEFSPLWIAELLFVSVVGGAGTIVGSALGASLYVYLQTLFAAQAYLSLLLMGSIVLVMLVVLPDGLWGYIASKLRVKPPV